MSKQRVQKFIALSGLCSRRGAEELIASGHVKVNGKTIKLGDQCLPTDEIKVKGKPITFDLEDKVYIIMNKPEGYVCSKNDPHNKKTVFDLLKPKDRKSNLFTVGRLDKETTGLLIITNDGDFAQKIIHPSSKIRKEYLTNLNRALQQKDRKELEKGVSIDGIKLAPCAIKSLTPTQAIVKISEGRKRQIRRMFETKRYRVTKLKRTKIGNLDLKSQNLKEGEYKIVQKRSQELTSMQLKLVKN